jgi:Cd2+/Zn2+-exporting ATPase
MKANTLYESSTVAKILDLVMNATDAKAKTENTVSKLSKVYTPLILLLALLVLIILPLFKIPLDIAFYRSLTFLVISCPCAIAISVPLSYFTGIGTCSNKGILIKGSNYLDNLWKIRAIAFDKTGTLTDGTFKIKSIDIIDNNYNEDKIIQILCSGESLSNHPLAKSVLSIYPNVKLKKVAKFKEESGKGISFIYDNMNVLIGTKIFCDCQYDAQIHMNINGKHVASINIDDGIKDNAKEVISQLKSLGIKTYMFTGDKQDKALLVSNLIGIDNYKSEMLPQDKYAEIEKIKDKGELVAFVGDGINDAPVIKLADIGIAMGNVGSTSAIEAADIVIMSDNLNKIITGIKISRFTNQIIKENLLFAILTKVIILGLSIFGLTTMWFAIFADTGVTLIAILNTLRITKK